MGVHVGLLCAAAFTFARWLTWDPFPRVALPYDVVVSLAIFGIGFAVARRLPPRLGAAGGWLLTFSVLAAVLYTALFVDNLHQRSSDRVLKLAHLAALALVGVLALRALRRPPGRRSLHAAAVLLAVAFVVAVVQHAAWPGSSLLFPLAAAAGLWSGFPRLAVLSAGRAAAGAIAAALVLALPLVRSSPPGSAFVLPPAAPAASAALGPSVILLVADTLRHDHLAAYGGARDTMPRLEQWMAAGMLFEDMSANSSWTLPSHASMFTGLYPRSHGAHGYPPNHTWGNAAPLAPGFDTLAERAADRGIDTGAIVANHFYLEPSFGVDQGFGTYWAPRPVKGLRVVCSEPLIQALQPFEYDEYAWVYHRARTVTDQVLRWLDARRDRPFFLFVNYMDAHTPCLRPACETVPQEDETTFREHQYDFWPGDELPPRVRRDLLNNYDRELVHLDRELGRLFAYLESSGLAATTTVVFTSDHGEYFGEHDLVFHSKALHAPVVRVPLMIRGPDVPAGRSAKPVQGIDLFPTILEQLGLEPAPGPARSVFADEASEVVAEWYYSESGLLLEKVPGRFERDLCSYRLGPLRAILSSRSDAESELYDLSNDPLERRDLSAGRGADLAVIRARVEAWLEAHPPAEQIRLDRSTLNEAERRAAAELGYAVEDE